MSTKMDRKPQPRSSTNKRVNLKYLLATSLTIIFIFNLLAHDLHSTAVEAKKLKKEKILKSLLKQLLIKKLSVKKNFLPLPVPIPGKWQELISQLNADDKTHRLGTSRLPSSTATGVLLELASLVSSNPTTSNIIHDTARGSNSIMGHLSYGSKNSHDSLIKGSLDIDKIKKFSRLFTAKFASRLVSAKAAFKPSDTSKHVISKLGKPLGFEKIDSVMRGNLESVLRHQGNPLVMIYNLTRFFKQLSELDSSKFLHMNKKSHLTQFLNFQNLTPYLSMNINNKKTLLNKINYIHSLTTSDFHHRHRSNRNI